jgi:hypothetical protein
MFKMAITGTLLGAAFLAGAPRRRTPSPLRIGHGLAGRAGEPGQRTAATPAVLMTTIKVQTTDIEQCRAQGATDVAAELFEPDSSRARAERSASGHGPKAALGRDAGIRAPSRLGPDR